jgi:hypothetical protein
MRSTFCLPLPRSLPRSRRFPLRLRPAHYVSSSAILAVSHGIDDISFTGQRAVRAAFACCCSLSRPVPSSQTLSGSASFLPGAVLVLGLLARSANAHIGEHAARVLNLLSDALVH